ILRIDPTSTNDSGTYFVNVSNTLGFVQSSSVTLKVFPLTPGPYLLSAEAESSTNGVILRFSESISYASATDPGNYTIGFFDNPTPVSFVPPIAYGGSLVRIRGITPWYPQSNYVISVSRLINRSGTAIPPDSRAIVSLTQVSTNPVVPRDAVWRF